MASKLNQYNPTQEPATPREGYLPSAGEQHTARLARAARHENVMRSIIARHFTGTEHLVWPDIVLKQLAMLGDRIAEVEALKLRLDELKAVSPDDIRDSLTHKIAIARTEAELQHSREAVAADRTELTKLGLQLPRSDGDLREACRPLWGERCEATRPHMPMDGLPEPSRLPRPYPPSPVYDATTGARFKQ